MLLSHGTKKLLLILLIVAGLFSKVFSQGDSQQELKLLLSEAESLSNRCQYDSAITYFESALFLTKKTENEAMVSYILRLMGDVLIKKGVYAPAHSNYILARKKAIKLKTDSLCARADIGLGRYYEIQGSLDSAWFYYNHALHDYETTNDTLGIGRALFNLSMFYQTKVDYEQSLKNALKAYRLLKKYGDTKLYTRVLMNLGNIYELLNEYDTAHSCYKMCYQKSLEINNLNLAAKALGNIALIYYYNKDYENAKTEFKNVIGFYEKLSDTNALPIPYINLSIILKKLGDYNESLELSKKALFYARKAENKEQEVKSLINLGIFYKQTGKLAYAESYYLEGIELAEKHDLKLLLQAGYKNVSLLYETMNDFKKAYTYLWKYVVVSNELMDEEKARAMEEYAAKYELLELRDKNRAAEMEKKKIRFERNLAYTIGAAVILLLSILIFFLRMRARKNRIIDAQRIQKLEDEKKLMAAQSVLVGQEKERERIARELHDGIGVLLSTASIHFSSVESKTDKETSDMLKKANKLLKDASKEVRQISHNMMPGVLSKFGLREAIEDLCEEVEDAGEIKIELNLKCKDDRLPENTEIMIYRIVQEMLNNTLKHAEASAIILNLAREEHRITIEYSDNGKGFDESKLTRDNNLGLSGIRTRVEYLGGTVVLETAPGKGTSYSISIPL